MKDQIAFSNSRIGDEFGKILLMLSIFLEKKWINKCCNDTNTFQSGLKYYSLSFGFCNQPLLGIFPRTSHASCDVSASVKTSVNWLLQFWVFCTGYIGFGFFQYCKKLVWFYCHLSKHLYIVGILYLVLYIGRAEIGPHEFGLKSCFAFFQLFSCRKYISM